MAGRTINVEQQVEKDRPQINFRSSNIRHQWLRDFPKTLDRSGIVNLGKTSHLNHLVLAFLVAARFADPIVSLQPYQFARDRTN